MGCWTWVGNCGKGGYGRFVFDGRNRPAHHFLLPPIPAGYEPHHTCYNPACVRPAHIEIVPISVNRSVLVRRERCGRVNAAKTHCPRNHEYTPENTYIKPNGGRVCRECKRLFGRNRRVAVAA